MLTVAVFPVVDQVAELESTIKSLEVQLEEQSSAADDAISQWHGRSSELERQLEILAKEKKEILNAESSSNALEVKELHFEKDRLEQELQERDEALTAAREDLTQDAEVVHEWEGKSFERCTLFSKSADTEIVFDADVCRLSFRRSSRRA
jgi:peptidoglycan hydrolase CwlO-like protein